MKGVDILSNIYLFYGEEKYDLEQRVEKIKKDFTNLEVGLNLFYINNIVKKEKNHAKKKLEKNWNDDFNCSLHF